MITSSGPSMTLVAVAKVKEFLFGDFMVLEGSKYKNISRCHVLVQQFQLPTSFRYPGVSETELSLCSDTPYITIVYH